MILSIVFIPLLHSKLFMFLGTVGHFCPGKAPKGRKIEENKARDVFIQISVEAFRCICSENNSVIILDVEIFLINGRPHSRRRGVGRRLGWDSLQQTSMAILEAFNIETPCYKNQQHHAADNTENYHPPEKGKNHFTRGKGAEKTHI